MPLSTFHHVGVGQSDFHCQGKQQGAVSSYEDAIPWKRFPNHLPSVRGIHWDWSLVHSPQQRVSNADVFCVSASCVNHWIADDLKRLCVTVMHHLNPGHSRYNKESNKEQRHRYGENPLWQKIMSYASSTNYNGNRHPHTVVYMFQSCIVRVIQPSVPIMYNLFSLPLNVIGYTFSIGL